jgi:hypothetical protein
LTPLLSPPFLDLSPLSREEYKKDKDELETVIHLFWECRWARDAVNRIMKYLGQSNDSILDLVSQVRDAILMNVYLEVRNPGGLDFGGGGI